MSWLWVFGAWRRAATEPALVLCRCRHDLDTHRHWRCGDDCGICGRIICPRFRHATWRQAWWWHLTGQGCRG